MEFRLLGSLVERKIGYGIVQPGQSVDGGVPVIKVNNLIAGLTSVKNLDTTSAETAAKYSRTKLRGGELIVSVVGTIGRTAIVPASFAGCNLVRATALIDIPEQWLSYWVKYYIDSPAGQAYIDQNLNTTVQPTLNIKSLVEMPIPFFEESIMKKTVAFLKAIDDKIANNNQINDNLQQQVYALFDSWFVSFDQTDGKMPADWREGTLGEITTITSGKRPPMKQPTATTEVSIPLVGAASIMGFTNAVLYSEPILVTGRVGTHGVVQRFQSPCWTSDNTLVIKSEFYEYAFQALQRVDYVNMNRGSTQPLITQTDLKNVSIVIPTEAILLEYEKIAGTLMAMYESNRKENERLAILRDTLLPRLMNGEIDVSNIEI